ncbi:hypothetical protein Fcan01_19203 [Folsomia candida]|uniref:Uncharacterized protein n=1 Tax=Folsomia candida TaxID=158441 RepID=A0A226DNJ8_FOLCA|nr:hypothetical protein Fcan01_19203 [Folsomia candida]
MLYNINTALKSLLISLLLNQPPKFVSPSHSQKNNDTPQTATWISFLNSLKYCTIQIFFYQSSHPRWETIDTLVTSVNAQLSFNFILENLEDPKNRYIRSNPLTWGYRGIIPNYPFGQNNLTKLYSNCHIVQLLCSSLLLVTWGMTAFNEDADYILVLDRDPPSFEYNRDYYFNKHIQFSLNSIVLHSPMDSEVLSIFCLTCTPPSDRENKERLISVTRSALTNLPRHARNLMKNMNHHVIIFSPFARTWNVPCSYKQHALLTSPHTCPMSELSFLFNFSLVDADSPDVGNYLGYAYVNRLNREEGHLTRIMMPGVVFRMKSVQSAILYFPVTYSLFALPTEVSVTSLIEIFDLAGISVLIGFGVCCSVIINASEKYLFTPGMWAISIFLQQGTKVKIKNNTKKLRVFMASSIISIWVFSSFIMSGMFGGEFFSIFTTNIIPQLPRNLKELSVTKEDVPIFTFSSSAENNTNVSIVSGTMIPELLNTSGYSETFRKMLRNLAAKIQLIENDNFAAAHNLSVDQTLYFNETRKLDERPNIFAMMDHPDYMHDFHVSLGIFKKYFIISGKEEDTIDTFRIPWITHGNRFGLILEENLQYMVEAGMIMNWENNYYAWILLKNIRDHHDRSGSAGKNFTNYFQRVVMARKERNSVDLVKEGRPIEGNKIKILFIIYAVCISLAASSYAIEPLKIGIALKFRLFKVCGCKYFAN